jgi:hypothetical protein
LNYEGDKAEDGTGRMERRWKIGRSFWRKPTENWKKRSKVCFWRGSEDYATEKEREREVGE